MDTTYQEFQTLGVSGVMYVVQICLMKIRRSVSCTALPNKTRRTCRVVSPYMLVSMLSTSGRRRHILDVHRSNHASDETGTLWREEKVSWTSSARNAKHQKTRTNCILNSDLHSKKQLVYEQREEMQGPGKFTARHLYWHAIHIRSQQKLRMDGALRSITSWSWWAIITAVCTNNDNW
jgi:hypothetical protein